MEGAECVEHAEVVPTNILAPFCDFLLCLRDAGRVLGQQLVLQGLQEALTQCQANAESELRRPLR